MVSSQAEALTDHSISHGEAVAIGICVDMLIASQLEMIRHNVALDVISTFQKTGYAIWHLALEQCNSKGELSIVRGLTEFKEHLGGKLTIPMPIGIGEMIDIHELPVSLVKEALIQLKDLAGVCN